MRVVLKFESERQQIVPQWRTSIPVDRAGRSWQIGVQLEIGEPLNVRFTHTGYSPREEEVAFLAACSAIQSCTLIKGIVELDLNAANDELTAEQKRKLIQEFSSCSF